jgi:hypothetical protein
MAGLTEKGHEPPRALLDVRKGGLEVYGGFIAVVVLVLGYLWWRKHSIRWYLDIIAPSAALGMAIGRIGCFLNGCCFGGVCDLPWAVHFPYGSGAQRQQWVDRTPGAELPQELLVFSPNGLWMDGTAAYPLARESLRATDTELAAAERQAQQAADRAKEMRERAKTVADAQAKQRLLVQARSAEGDTLRHFEMRSQMKRYDLSAAEVRAIARQHPSLPVHPAQLYSTITLGLLAVLVVTAAWAAVLGRLAGQEDVVIGTPVANRSGPEFESIVGLFVNTLALRIDLSGGPSVAQLLDRVQGAVVAAQDHQVGQQLRRRRVLAPHRVVEGDGRAAMEFEAQRRALLGLGLGQRAGAPLPVPGVGEGQLGLGHPVDAFDKGGSAQREPVALGAGRSCG